MSVSMIEAQRNVILSTIHRITQSDWKVLILDRDSKRVLDNVIEEDTLLNENITNIEQITDRRQTNRDVDALYFLTPQQHIVECVMADFQKRKYRKAHLVWTSLLHPSLRDRIDKSPIAREQIAQFTTLNVEYYPRESHLVTFRDPWSFPILFHPACNNLVRQHMEDVAQKIVGVCVALGEYPTIRYYRPPAPTHEAASLCSHLARFVQEELDLYAKFHNDFPPPTNRPRGTLYIVDRSMDLVAPLVHEFTYQAMAHDLLPIKEGDKITYRTTINEGQPDEEEKDIPITDRDRLWTDNRHRHMKDVIEKLMADFQKFIRDNPNFTSSSQADLGGQHGLNAIKDMMAGLPQFQEMKEAYALHLGMAQESMNRFQKYKLGDLSLLEQICATGLDDDYKKPKHLADQIVRMLDEEDIPPPDRLRLLILYLLHRDGLLPADAQKLLAHAQLPASDQNIFNNLLLLGANTTRRLKDSRPSSRPPLFPPKQPPPPTPNARPGMQEEEELLTARFTPALQSLLEAHATGTLDTNTFIYTKPPLDMGAELTPSTTASSLRSAPKPTWARTRTNVSTETRQRIIVFVAGGATFSEARACYEVGAKSAREVFLVTSHMLTPTLFLRQLGDLSAEKRRLAIPAEQPKPQVPAHLLEPEPEVPKPAAAAPPTAQMAGLSVNGAGRANGQSVPPASAQVPAAPAAQGGGSSGFKVGKEIEKDKKEKKKHKFGFKKS